MIKTENIRTILKYELEKITMCDFDKLTCRISKILRKD